jgi:hypothetical protein
MGTRMIPAVRLTATLVGAALALVACSSEPTDIPRIEAKTFTVKPATLPVRIGVLSGQLMDLTVLERVNVKTGEVVYAPQLRGTIHLKNTSSDQAVRLVNGQVEYLAAGGARIGLASDRGDTSFRFYSSSHERLDPGMEVTQSLEVPFPAAALKGDTLAEVRLNVRYIATPYREESVEIPVALAGRDRG